MADSFQVLFGGQAADEAFYNLVTSVEVEENADLPGALQLSFPVAAEGSQGSEDLTLVGEDRFQPYARIAVIATPDGGTAACIFDGCVLSHKVHVDRGTTAATLTVWGQDVTCLMNLKEQVRDWNGKTDGEAANAIFDGYGFFDRSYPAENTQDDSPSHDRDSGPTLIQRATDAQFLRDRARRGGKLFRVACNDTANKNTAYFIKPKLGESPVATLTLNPPDAANVDALDFAWDVARPTHAYAQVLVGTKDADKVDTTAAGLDLLDNRSLATFVGDDNVMEARLTAPAGTKDELKQRAVSILREAGWFVTCEGETDLARLGKVLRAAKVVRVNGAGKIHSGNYYVWSVRHTITSQAHRMRFVLVRNAIGRA